MRVEAPDRPDVHGKVGKIVSIDAPFLMVKVEIEGNRLALGAEDVRLVGGTSATALYILGALRDLCPGDWQVAEEEGREVFRLGDERLTVQRKMSGWPIQMSPGLRAAHPELADQLRRALGGAS